MTSKSMQDKACIVLLIEDNMSNAKLTLHALSKAQDPHFQVEHFELLAGGLARLARGGVDVALVDLSLPDSCGIETVRAIRAMDHRVPIVVLTGFDDEQFALEMLNHGAQDYLLKDEMEPKLLARSLRFAMERQRSAELASLNGQLADAQALLNKKNRRLAKLYRTAYEFVENVSHEFRSPLTVIKEYASLVNDGVVGTVTPDQRQMLAVVEDRADDLNTMVDDMLDVSKLESGLLGVYRKNCKVDDIVARVRPGLLRKASVKGVKLEFESASDLPAVYCDPEKVSRVLINLITNAIKFCGQPGRIHISCHRDPDRPGVRLSVSDNGHGISIENQEAIFRRFKQLDEPTQSSTKGFGLGLNIAKQLVELNLGRISLDSRIGRGSTFFFTLPPADPLEVLARYLERVEHLTDGSSQVCLVQAVVDETASETLADDANAFLSCLLRGTDLLFRADQKRWLVVLPMPESEISAFRDRVESSIGEANRNRLGEPMTDIRLDYLGEWHATSNPNQILDRLGAALHSEGAIYA